ncbi:stage V sporulation protein D [Fervidibacillus albus]|uniref:serine-type D-Ala-D-Ala carboxypeptidase n=1 Tax=Fervidibacillus albus TaxID=2980026 RepID=A0A9E8LXJ7_9BACI|nr:stage V sporulation protein D [Fervidibacillus albus]WAA10629.1 stage V sporulation protein D [Fervidibacillus albus]
MGRVSQVTVRKRLVIMLISGLIVFFIIDLRLGYVQLYMGNMLTEKAKYSWNREIPFEPKRGEIIDRNGIPLATNKSAPTIHIVPRQVKNPAETAKQLAQVLEISEEKMYEYVTKNESIVTVPEGKKISNEKAKEVRSLNLEGVYISEDFLRHYPFGSYLSHVLGFTGIDNQGLTGLELAYDQQLAGEKGSVQFYSTAKGNLMENMADEYRPPVDGLNLKLTIDSEIQTIVERELDIAEAKYNPDGIIAIAMDPNTGEILAMASRPNFNPAEFETVSPEVYNRNLPIWSTYEPGSTFKIITLAAAIEENKVDLEHDHFYDPGYVEVGGTQLHCWKSGGHGSQTFLEVVQNSCNPGFVELGQRLGAETLFNYIKDFGFGEKTGIDLQGEGTGILFSPDQIGPVELATTSFGQGVSVTPIQQVVAVSAAINGGTLYQPYVAKELINPDTGEVVMRNTPTVKRKVISEETSKQLTYALESVVAQGTGKNAFVDGYRVGGKTGTAQKAKDGYYLADNYIVSFIGFAPSDDPQIVIYVAVDHPKGTVQFGGTVAAPIVGKIIEDSMHVLDVDKRDDQIEKERTWLDRPIVEVPDLIGLEKKDIPNQYFQLKIEVEGSGNTIIDQAPEPGTKVEEGSTIRIILN